MYRYEMPVCHVLFARQRCVYELDAIINWFERVSCEKGWKHHCRFYPPLLLPWSLPDTKDFRFDWTNPIATEASSLLPPSPPERTSPFSINFGERQTKNHRHSFHLIMRTNLILFAERKLSRHSPPRRCKMRSRTVERVGKTSPMDFIS